MPPLKAHVQNGRIVLDEPTDLPEGEVIYLRPAEAFVGDDDDDNFDDEERAAIQKDLDAGMAAIAKGDVVDADEVVRQLLSRG